MVTLFIVFSLCLNLAASVFLLKAGVSYNRKQKLLQLSLIWLVPWVGALMVIMVLRSDLKKINVERDLPEVVAARNQEGKYYTGGIGRS